MNSMSARSQATLVELSQHADTPPHELTAGRFSLRYAYMRAPESRAAGEPGQDYLAFSHDGRSLVFAVCDGVSQSFYGDLAARLVGAYVVEWLWGQGPDTLGDAAALSNLLTADLRQLAAGSAALVAAQHAPSTASPLLRAVLEEKRVRGSEAMLVAGRLDAPGLRLPGGRLALIWLGDCRVRLWAASGEELTWLLGTNPRTPGRWSTAGGPIGELRSFAAPLQGASHASLCRVMAYSDGLANLDREPFVLSTERLLAGIQASEASPHADDVAFFEVTLDVPLARRAAGPLA